MKRWGFFAFLLAIPSLGWSPVSTHLNITEEDGSPSTFPYKAKFANGTVTDNGDGTVSITNSGGGGGSPNGSVNAANQYSIPYYSVSGSSNVLSGATGFTTDNSSITVAIPVVASSVTVTGNLTDGLFGSDYSVVFGPVTSASAPGSGLLTAFYPSGSSTAYIKRMMTNSSAGVNLRGESWFEGSSNNRAFRIDTVFPGGGIFAYRPVTLSSGTTFTGGITISTTVKLGTDEGVSGQVLTSAGPSAVPTWTTPTSGGGASPLAIATGTLAGFTVPGTSPTAVINLNSSLFTSALTGGATAYVTLVLSSVTALGSDIDVSGSEISGVLKAAAFPALTGDITTSAGALATTAASSQPNIKTFTSSITVTGPGGIGNTYGLTTGSETITSGAVSINGVLYSFPSGVGAGGVFNVNTSSVITVTAAGAGNAVLSATQTWSGQNNWITPAQSTFTYGLTVGSLTVSGTGAGFLQLTEGTNSNAPASGVDNLWADSSSHTIVFNPNASSTYTVVGASTTPTIGNLAKWSSQWGLIDGGTAGAGDAVKAATQTFSGGNTFSGTVTLSSAVVIPNGASPLVDATGKMAFDTTAGQLLVHDGSVAQVVGSSTYTFTVTISSGIGWNGLKLPIWRAPTSESVTLIKILAESLPTATTVQYALGESAFGSINVSSSSIFSVAFSSANNTGVTTTSFNDSSIASQASIVLYTPSSSASSGTPDSMTVTVYYKKDRQ